MRLFFPQKFYDHRTAGHWEMPTTASWYQRTAWSVWVSITFHNGDTLRIFLSCKNNCKCFFCRCCCLFVCLISSYSYLTRFPYMYPFNDQTCYILKNYEISHLLKNMNCWDWLLMFSSVPAGILIRVVTLNSTRRSV